MPSIGARLVLAINRLFPQMNMHKELEAAKEDEFAYAAWEIEEGQKVVPDFGPAWDIRSKSLLDVGSGLGGKPVLYHQLGAGRVTGLDLRPRSAQIAADFVRSQACEPGSVRFLVCDAARMPFRNGSFDDVVSINVFEHVAQPLEVLQESVRVVRREGHVFVRFSPWYSPWAPHLDGWINWPWPHLFFREPTLIEAANIVEDQKHLNARLIPSGKLDLRGCTELPELNRVSVRQFEGMVRSVPARADLFDLAPLGFHFFGQRGHVGRMVLGLLRIAVRLPGLRELLTTKIVCVLRKE